VFFCHGWSNRRTHLGRNGLHHFIPRMKKEVDVDEEIGGKRKIV